MGMMAEGQIGLISEFFSKPFVSHSQRQKEQQLCFFVVQKPVWLPFEAVHW
jgi:hypothetical protein